MHNSSKSNRHNSLTVQHAQISNFGHSQISFCSKNALSKIILHKLVTNGNLDSMLWNLQNCEEVSFLICEDFSAKITIFTLLHCDITGNGYIIVYLFFVVVGVTVYTYFLAIHYIKYSVRFPYVYVVQEFIWYLHKV